MVRRHPNKLLEKHKKENEELKAKLAEQAKQLEAMGTGPPPQKKQKKGEKTDEEKAVEVFFLKRPSKCTNLLVLLTFAMFFCAFLKIKMVLSRRRRGRPS